MGKMQPQHFASHGVNITFNEHEFVKDSTQEPPEIYHDQNMPFLSFQGLRIFYLSEFQPSKFRASNCVKMADLIFDLKNHQI